MVTYGLLGSIAVVYAFENFVRATNPAAFVTLFVITPAWISTPWTLVTSTLSHGSFQHLLFNGLFLYFFGPTIEYVIGRAKYIVLFLATGALSGILQVSITQGGALGASGALMALLGISVVLMPKAKMFVWPIFVPVPLWLAGIGYALLDVLGVFNPGDGIGHVAHLSGLIIGLLFGLRVKNDLGRRGLVLRGA